MSFICALSWTSTSVEMCLNSSLFNLLTFKKRVLNLAGSLARSESHVFCVVIGCSPVMSHIHVDFTNSGSKPELTKKVDDQHHGTNKAGLEWFGFVNLKLILNLFIMVQAPGVEIRSNAVLLCTGLLCTADESLGFSSCLKCNLA